MSLYDPMTILDYVGIILLLSGLAVMAYFVKYSDKGVLE